MRAVHFIGLALLFMAVSSAPAAEATEAVEGMESCDACENQMFDCSDMCDCAWGGSDIVQCMMCNSKCTKKKCAEYCERLAAGGKRRAPLSAASMGNMFGGGQ